MLPLLVVGVEGLEPLQILKRALGCNALVAHIHQALLDRSNILVGGEILRKLLNNALVGGCHRLVVEKECAACHNIFAKLRNGV